MQAALDQTKGNKVQAATALAISRRTLYRLMRKHGLEHVEEKSEARNKPT